MDGAYLGFEGKDQEKPVYTVLDTE